ncbi:MAG: hydantoinase B/oxoprolinase family protein [Pseudomonadota bacterium]|jgi:N-methylhydantoinase B|nr:hydantoinase B/oxoprolinase family protein [Pseudomonadota bacterium]
MKTDPVTLELFKNALFSIADEMAVTICRTTYSGVLRDNMDFSTAFTDADGKLVAQGLTIPLHLGSIPTALESVLAEFEGDIHPGDVFVINDPYHGGMHLPDVFIFKPIFVDGERLAFGATISHQADVGGRVPGSNASDSTEIYQEGLRIPPIKLYERGQPNQTMWTMIETNVRIPVQVTGDMRAQLSACNIAEQQFLELVDRFGLETTRHYMQAVIEYAERLTRAGISGLPDGEYSFEDWIDDDGIDRERPIRLFCTIEKHGDALKVDWDGSSAQVRGAINCTLSFTKAVSYAAVRSVLPFDIPCNEGLFRAIEVTAPSGTITNMELPAACAARGLTGFRMGDCVYGALAKMLPDRVGAASDGGNTGVTVGGYDEQRKPFIFVDFACGSWGGRPWADGVQGNSNMFANMASQSIELIEAENPLQVLAYELITDRAGVGEFRGGVPYRRDYLFTEKEAVLQVRSDRRRFRPYGLYGGQAGQPSQNILNPHAEAQMLDSKLTMPLKEGDVFRHELPGGGGWGDPMKRDPDKVLMDVRNEFVSIESARDDYGVVIDCSAWQVDEDATQTLRNARHDESRNVTASSVVQEEA